MPRKKIHLPLRPVDFPCLNCDQPVTLTTVAKLYCSDLCSDEAHFVRYFRARKSDGRINQPDIKLALQMRMGHILAGGYKERERRLPDHVRRTVFARDKSLCQECGEPGTDVDHIEGSSNELENLQVLCKRCHNEKTLSKFVPLPPEDEEGGAESRAKIASLLFRVHSLAPQRACDDEEGWDTFNQQVMSERRQALREERLRYKKMSKAEETKIDIDLLTQELNDLGKLEEQREALEQDEEANIAQFYTPEIKAQVEKIKVEFADRAESIDKEIDVLKARVKLRVVQYGETVRGANLLAVLRKGRTSWDTEAIDQYAESHPKILVFRTSWDIDSINEYAETHPEILVCRMEGQPNVIFRKIRRKSNSHLSNE
jgi:5-methylcytosine-specific restriction endonuclease McrA